MNAVNALLRDNQEAAAERAIAAAATWVDTARPLIALYLRLDDEDSALCRVPHQDENVAVYEAVRDGCRIVNEAMVALFAEIVAIRDAAISTATGPYPGGGVYDPAVIAYDELCEVVGDATIGVDKAIDRIARAD